MVKLIMENKAMYGISKRGRKTLIYQDFEFWQHRIKNDGNIMWRCNKSRELKCKATIEAADSNVVSLGVVEHNHESNVASALAKLAVSTMKKQITESSSNPSSILTEVSSQLSAGVLIALPKKSSVTRILRRHRQKALATYDNKNSLPPT